MSEIEERFWQLVAGGDAEACWIWRGAPDVKGYGRLYLPSRREQMLAHRASWIIHHGAIPDGLCVLHDCPSGDNPLCVNPNHLWIGTRAENNADAKAKGRSVPPQPHPGDSHPQAKLSSVKVVAIRQAYRSGQRTQREIAIAYGVSESAVNDVLNGRRWGHVQ